jgi:hypothetical protein
VAAGVALCVGPEEVDGFAPGRAATSDVAEES